MRGIGEGVDIFLLMWVELESRESVYVRCCAVRRKRESCVRVFWGRVIVHILTFQ